VCNVWADPHLIAFAPEPGMLRPQYWCKVKGEYLLYKNKWVYFNVTSNDYPYTNEKVNTNESGDNLNIPNIFFLIIF